MAKTLLIFTVFLFLRPGLGLHLDWSRRAGFEYAFVDHSLSDFRGNYTWWEAEDVCMENGGYLLSLETKREYEMLLRLRPTNPSKSNSVYWSGLNRLDKLDEWVWSDGKADSLNIGENRLGYRERNMKCATFEQVFMFRWSALNCGETRSRGRNIGFICKRKAGDSTPKSRQEKGDEYEACPDREWSDGGRDIAKCYQVFRTEADARRGRIDWKYAEGSCLSLPYNKPNLACVNTQEELAALSQVADQRRPEYRYWFGLARDSATDPWTWSDNSRVNVTHFHKYFQPKTDFGHGFVYGAWYATWDVARKDDGDRAKSQYYVCQIEKERKQN